MHSNEMTFEFCLYDAQEIMFTCAEKCDLFDSSCQKVCTELYIEGWFLKQKTVLSKTVYAKTLVRT